MKDHTLLATFIKTRDLYLALKTIEENFEVMGGIIYVLNDLTNVSEKGNINKFILSYSIKSTDINFNEVLPGTVHVHRNRDYSILYTLNAMNELNRIHGGVGVDSDDAIIDLGSSDDVQPGAFTPYNIPWKDYEKSIVTMSNGVLRVVNTSLNFIVNI